MQQMPVESVHHRDVGHLDEISEIRSSHFGGGIVQASGGILSPICHNELTGMATNLGPKGTAALPV